MNKTIEPVSGYSSRDRAMSERDSVILRLNGVMNALEALKATLLQVPWRYRRLLAGVSWVGDWIESVRAAVTYLQEEG